VSSYRYEGPEVNTTLAKAEAKTLHEKISDKAYGDDDLIRIIATRSKAQLSATLNHYNNEYGNAITKVPKQSRFFSPPQSHLRFSCIKCREI